MTGDQLETVPIHRALTRSNLFLGGDRELVMFSGLLAGTMVFYTFEWKSAMAGATNATDLKVVVAFDDPAHGRKTLLSKFAKLEII